MLYEVITIREAARRAGVDVDEIEDVIMGCAMQQGSRRFLCHGSNKAQEFIPHVGLYKLAR